MQDPAQNPYAANTQTPGGGGSGQRMMPTIAAAARVASLISFALIMGVSTISGILAFLILSNPPQDQSLFRFNGDAMPFIAVGFAVFIGSVVAALVVPRVIIHQGQMQFQSSEVSLPQPLRGDSPLPWQAQAFLGALSTGTLIGQALLEGSAVLNAVLMFIDHNFAHAIPIGLAIVGILMQIPSQSKWINQLEDSKRERSM